MLRQFFSNKSDREDEHPSGQSYNDINALFISCTLTKSPGLSHTETLMDLSRAMMRGAGAQIDSIRLVDHEIASGVMPDMTRHGWKRDDWPQIWKKIDAADILVVGTPIWLGQYSSECSKLIERLFGQGRERNEKGQNIFYGKTGGCMVTGNEDGIKHVGMGVLYALQHLGFTVPPQADCGWIGEVGPGESYGDVKAGGGCVGFDNEFTQRNTTFMTWNLLHFARMLKEHGGIAAHGNSEGSWKDAFEKARR